MSPYWTVILFLINDLRSTQENQYHRNAGIYFRINQKAVDYITELASDAMPQILNNMKLPNVSLPLATISNIHIDRVERPEIETKFVRDKGVRANVSLPFLKTSAFCTVDYFIPLDGNFVVELHNFTVDLELHITRNVSSGTNIIEVPHCVTTHSNVSVLLDKDSLLMMVHGVLHSTVTDTVKTKICEVILDAVKFVDAQELQSMDIVTSTIATAPADSVFNPTEFGASLCGERLVADSLDSPYRRKSGHKAAELVERVRVPTTTLASTVDSARNNTGSGIWTVNLDVVFPAKFSDEDVVFGVDGGILFNGAPAINVGYPTDLNVSVLHDKMIGILLTDIVPNTFFSHIFAKGMGAVHKRFEIQHLPKTIGKIAHMMCSKCFLDISANITEQPRVEINAKHGVRAEVAGNVLVQFKGRDDFYNLIHASTKLYVTLKPTVRHSRLYGDVSLTNVDVKIFDLGVGGLLSKPIENLVSFVVPQVLWPQVKKRIRFAINKRGIELPALCGVTFDHASLSYIDHAAVVNT
ncbi:hypothetical protein KIN20_030120 [Parelaphostrongylus tenuis]|uniref:Lipid-binding serum glycoprotein C-terminal domain-containing protein n=1 Tax=Parelaphostrongylus tenuis TaxID=148309 RepID=A0AAD5WG45_PARTN|nr:hypothetical protein KIN20_030120 [Parelaphostrongylus tenuis]